MKQFSCHRNRRTTQMLLLHRIEFKMATNQSTSDFPIDHILNRAGDRFRKCERFEAISMSGSSSGDECDNYERNYCQNGYGESERFMEIPAFDWLNYTRYNMPRMPREFATEVI